MKRFIETYGGETVDLIVIGGGISGAAVAYDAALRGLSVALVEKQDFGCATSAATSKLIHGGFRYLAQAEFCVVRESLHERRTLENIAPNFVYPLPVMVASYHQSFTDTAWAMKAGMVLYDLLSFDKGRTWSRSKRLPLHRSLAPAAALRLEPALKRRGLRRAFVFYDCQCIFPERLTLAFIKSAVAQGAQAANYAKAEGFLFSSHGSLLGVRVKDILSGRTHELKGRLIINCGGPWADLILGLAKKGMQGGHIRRSEGIHLITKKLANEHMVVSMTAEGRHCFLIPWRGHTLIGTTDKEYIGDPDAYRVTKESVLELLREANETFGLAEPLGFEDVLFAYGGLRPLVESRTQEVYKSSRKYEIYDHAEEGLEGLITVEGGKYTTSRNLAEKVLQRVGSKLGRDIGSCKTDQQHLADCKIDDMPSFLRSIAKEHRDFPEHTLSVLGAYYGTAFSKVLDLARTDRTLAEPLNADGEIGAQVLFGVREEMARTLKDILFRRTGLGTLGHPGAAVVEGAAEIAAEELNWDSARKEREIEGVREAYTLY